MLALLAPNASVNEGRSIVPNPILKQQHQPQQEEIDVELHEDVDLIEHHMDPEPSSEETTSLYRKLKCHICTKHYKELHHFYHRVSKLVIY
jgi:hypothetical protein